MLLSGRLVRPSRIIDFQIQASLRSGRSVGIGFRWGLGTASSYAEKVESADVDIRRRRRIKFALFCSSLILSIAGFLAVDYLYSRAILGSAVSGGSHGFCFSRDPLRGFAFRPNCTSVRPWLGASYEFETNSLGFRDERIREVSARPSKHRILILGDSAPEGMTDWQDSFIGRLAARFPQYEFLNASVEGYSPSNYLNTVRILFRDGIQFDEALVFMDISDAQDEAAFFHDVDASGKVGTAGNKASMHTSYSELRLWINDHLLLTNTVFSFFERQLVRLGWYHLDLGHGGNEFDLERSAWTYRPVSDRELYETGYGPLGLEGGIAKEKTKMDTLWRELQQHNIPLSVVVFPWPAQVAHDNVDSRQVRIWRQWCGGRCFRFIDVFPPFFAVKNACPLLQPGCWYTNYFIFGDTHYNSAGDAIMADALSSALIRTPPLERRVNENILMSTEVGQPPGPRQ